MCQNLDSIPGAGLYVVNNVIVGNHFFIFTIRETLKVDTFRLELNVIIAEVVDRIFKILVQNLASSSSGGMRKT